MKKLISISFALIIFLASCTQTVYTDTTAPKAVETESVCLGQDGNDAKCESDVDCCTGFVCVKEDQSKFSNKTCILDK